MGDISETMLRRQWNIDCCVPSAGCELAGPAMVAVLSHWAAEALARLWRNKWKD